MNQMIQGQAMNFYRYKTFAVFKSVTFENFQIFLQIIIGIKINTFWAFSENFKSDTFESDKNCVTFKSVTFEKFLIFMENTFGIIPNTFHDFQKKIQKWHFWKLQKFCTCRTSEPIISI